MKRVFVLAGLMAGLFSLDAGADNIYKKGWIDFNKNV